MVSNKTSYLVTQVPAFQTPFFTLQLAAPAFDVNGMIYGSQTAVDYAQRSQAEWLHMQVGSGFERAT